MSPHAKPEGGSEQHLRESVADVLGRRGYLLVPPDRFEVARVLGQPIYTRQFEAGDDLYGKPGRVDFILYHPSLHGECLAIRCRSQATSGSAEEESPPEVESIRLSGLNTIIVLDGGGYTGHARDRLADHVGKGGLVAVLDLAGLASYAASGKI